MQTLFFLILGSFMLVCQTSLLTRLPAWVGNPDLLFLLVVYVSIRMPDLRGFFLAIFFGLLMDVFSGLAPGLFPFIYGGLFLTAKLLARRIIFDEPTHHPALTAFSYLACHSIIYLYLEFFSQDIDLFWSWHDLLLAMLIQAVLTLPLFQLFDHLQEIFSADGGHQWLPRRGGTGNRFTA
jgi:rod shape-determining protein MreD